MGQALIFSGIKVDNPLSIVTFIKRNVTAQDYVDDYKSVVPTITEEQEAAIKLFIETLIINDIWDKVERCYPMLGGIGYYTYDLKKITNQSDWDFPEDSVTWDNTRNAPFISIAGLKYPKNIVITGLDCIDKGCAFFFSTKNFRTVAGVKLTDSSSKPSFINQALWNSNGGHVYPNWCTTVLNESIVGLDTKAKNKNCNYLLDIKGGKNYLYAWNDDKDAIYINNGDTATEETTTDAIISLGSGISVQAEAPVESRLNGCVNIFMVFNQYLSVNEIGILNDAVYGLNQGLGRLTDFE